MNGTWYGPAFMVCLLLKARGTGGELNSSVGIREMSRARPKSVTAKASGATVDGIHPA